MFQECDGGISAPVVIPENACKKVANNVSIHHFFPIQLKRLLFNFLKLWMSF